MRNERAVVREREDSADGGVGSDQVDESCAWDECDVASFDGGNSKRTDDFGTCCVTSGVDDPPCGVPSLSAQHEVTLFVAVESRSVLNQPVDELRR